MSTLYVVRRVRYRGRGVGWGVYRPGGDDRVSLAAAYSGSLAWCRARFCAVRLNRRVIRDAR